MPELAEIPHRRFGDLPWYGRAGVWTLAPFVEDWRGLSLVRVMAITFTVAAVHGAFVHEKALTLIDLSFATLAVCSALGGKYVMAFLQRGRQDVIDARQRRSQERPAIRESDIQVPQGD